MMQLIALFFIFWGFILGFLNVLNVVILLIVYCFILWLHFVKHFVIFICEKCSKKKLYLLTYLFILSFANLYGFTV